MVAEELAIASFGLEKIELQGNQKTELDQAFSAIYVELGESIYRYCLYRTGSPSEAEDISADVFARLYSRGFDGFGDNGHLRAWLFKVAGNLCINHHRRLMHKAEGAESAAQSVDSSHSLINDNRLIRAFSRLKADEQTALYLRAIEDLSFSDISEAMERRQGAVKMLFYRGTKKLRAYLDNGGAHV